MQVLKVIPTKQKNSDFEHMSEAILYTSVNDR